MACGFFLGGERRGSSSGSSTDRFGTVLLTHSAARLTSSSWSASASSLPSVGNRTMVLWACHLRNCDGESSISFAAPASALSVGVCVSRGGRLGVVSGSRLWEGRCIQEFCLMVPVGCRDCCPGPGATAAAGRSASRGPRDAPRAAAGEGSPGARCRKLDRRRRSWAQGRTAVSTVRTSRRKSTKSFENFDGSLRPVGGLFMMTNIARVGGMW
mmetsp:Transcript_100508/g.309997  ORF Transcript_100508/g.309997 Transcript_100508/m.309997 type:complete len:213 (+) Transcript_100508:275-913(+)